MQKKDCRLTYQGDAVLAGLLAKAGSVYTVAEVRSLISGVLGSAEERDPEAWCVLVASSLSSALVAQLVALKDQVAHDEAPAPVEAATHGKRLAAVRAGLAKLGVDGFLVPRADEFQNEYVPAGNERLQWLTGFKGSAGAAVVLADRAAIFVDGRYTVQVRAEVDANLFEFRHFITEPPEEWVATALKAGQRFGYDPWLLTPAQVDKLRAGVTKAGAELVPVETNPLDAAWERRPAAPLGPVRPHDLEFSGKSSTDKRREIGEALGADKRDATVLTMADSLAWLLNIRGSDVPHTPLALGLAILDKEGQLDLFIDRRKLAPGLESHLGNSVAVRDMAEFGPALDAMGGKVVQVDPATTASWVFDRLGHAGAKLVRAADPCKLPKAVKNEVELDGSRRAHRRDAAAMVRFLAWLAAEAPKGGLTEIAVSDRLEAFRAEGARFRDLSFPSISAAGPNAALPHYRSGPETERSLEPGTLYLIDSGAQYLDGTTDITRTIAIGSPTAEMKDRYTRVLKGHIALSMARFPKGTTGGAIDVLARLPLWQAGVNFDHGTGHGVGSYLSVHEGPQRIAAFADTQPLMPGMILSNEPGYYKEGHFGIRIENLIVVTTLDIPGAEREMYGFETITFCPIDRTPIDLSLLTVDEIAWLDTYHAKTREIVLPLLDDPAARAWLEATTAPL
ncbi:MAG TPA: aminopeptidase P family protein [Aliidongia sp.]|uniref:aminopeptidase P family protein n=1 Tax=Aliidongia sp. TaxID=1914230 RepID=UPI002DDD1EB3|nr:aminopeptidase P family protein [Aliidongia sp.]HEV2676679.1 aminopeptidase P family protein [Aliidongia sp.]